METSLDSHPQDVEDESRERTPAPDEEVLTDGVHILTALLLIVNSE